MENRHIGREIRELNNLCRRYLVNSVMKIYNDEFTSVHIWVLHYLFLNSDRDVFQKDFESEFKIRRSTASNILSCMEKKQLVKRESVKSDARLKKIVLTPNGEKLHTEFGKILETNNNEMQKGISKEELDTFFKVSEKIKKNVEEQC